MLWVPLVWQRPKLSRKNCRNCCRMRWEEIFDGVGRKKALVGGFPNISHRRTLKSYSNSTNYPTLAAIAKDYFTVQASSVPSHSLQKLIWALLMDALWVERLWKWSNSSSLPKVSLSLLGTHGWVWVRPIDYHISLNSLSSARCWFDQCADERSAWHAIE